MWECEHQHIVFHPSLQKQQRPNSSVGPLDISAGFKCYIKVGGVLKKRSPRLGTNFV